MDELKEVPIFSGMGTKGLVRVLSSLERQHFLKGTTIIQQGDPGDSFYIIRRGNVEVDLVRGGKPSIRIAQLGPKEGFGEMALLTGEPRAATVVAETDVEAWRISKEAFDGLLSENLSLALHLNRVLSQRLQALQKRLVP